MNKTIGIAGGSGSGKTTLAREIVKTFSQSRCVIISQDSYYVDQSARFDVDGGAVNFDHPDSLDFDLLHKHILQLKNNKIADIPQYDFKTHKRLITTNTVVPHKFIIIEGTLLLHVSKIRDSLDLKIFLDVDEDIRFQRRLKRDVEERGRDPEGIRNQFYSQVKPMHDEFVEPTKKFADMVLTKDEYLKCLEFLNLNQ